MAHLKMENVSLTYHTVEGEIEALRDINLEVLPQQFLAIVGPSGCGKSTLLSLISGLLKPSSGKITLNGQDIVGTTTRVGYMLQQDYLFDWRTILDNTLLGLEVRKQKSKANVEKVKQMIKDYGLGGFEHNYPYQLSGGMKQRVALIRTLAMEPDLLLLDEPFSALDYQNRLAVGEEVISILRKAKKTVIMVTHDIPEAISMANQVVVLTSRPGRVRSKHEIKIHKEGLTPLQARESPQFREYFSAIWKELNADGK